MSIGEHYLFGAANSGIFQQAGGIFDAVVLQHPQVVLQLRNAGVLELVAALDFVYHPFLCPTLMHHAKRICSAVPVTITGQALTR